MEKLFKAANQFGVQVFATTHSTDCIRGFLAAQSEMLKLGENFISIAWNVRAMRSMRSSSF